MINADLSVISDAICNDCPQAEARGFPHQHRHRCESAFDSKSNHFKPADALLVPLSSAVIEPHTESNAESAPVVHSALIILLPHIWTAVEQQARRSGVNLGGFQGGEAHGQC